MYLLVEAELHAAGLQREIPKKKFGEHTFFDILWNNLGLGKVAIIFNSTLLKM